MAATADRIVVAAHRLLERHGAEAVTMRRVADAVGITAMAIYRHYPDRAALLNAIADRGFAQLAAQLGALKPPGSKAGIEAVMNRMTDVYLDHALAHPRLFELMFLAPRKGARRYPRDFKAGKSPTANAFVAAIEHGMARGELRRDDPWEVTFEIGALVDGLILLYLGGRFDGGPARFRALVKRSLRRYVHGIRT
jgi:AcrR family transcriptional regulator